MPSSKKTNKRGQILHFTDDSITLSSGLESWLNQLNVDLEQYKNELNNVLKNKKQRYYRIVDKSFVSNDNIVNWIRDVDIYLTNSNISKSCYGIDASSAVIVDSLRLKWLSHLDQVWILDMCCAPGGKLLATVNAIHQLNLNLKSPKSTHITQSSTFTASKWNLIGLDSIKRRLDVCRSMLNKENYNRQHINVILKCTRSQEFLELEHGQSMLGKFDRIILDVECTHEGSLRSVIRTLKYWGIESLENKWNKEYSSKIITNQKELLIQAIKLVKPGGFIVYSTCSLDKEQNELLVSEVINQFNNLKLYPLPVNSCECCSYNTEKRKETWPIESCMSLLKENCNKDSFYKHEKLSTCRNSDSPVAVRFNPLKSNTDGLFIALILKDS